jgi:hypothetical protein
MPLQLNTSIGHGVLTFTEMRGGTIEQPVAIRILETTKLQRRASAAAVMARAAVSNKKYSKMRRRWRTLTAKIKARAR